MVSAFLAGILGVTITACAVLTWLVLRGRKQLARYAPVANVEAHVQQVHRELETTRQSVAQEIIGARAEVERQRSAAAQQLGASQQQLGQVQTKLEQDSRRLHALHAELRSVEEELETQSFGFYRPHYSFTDSDQFREAIKRVRDKQKTLVREDRATQCPNEWTVDGSAAKGRKMVREHMKLMLRAFNGECDAAIARVRYNNVLKMEARITKSCEAINRLGKSKNVWITKEYVDLKLRELHLTHEHHELIQQQKEEQRRIKEQMREELKAQKEIEKAEANSEAEEARHKAALERAREELAQSTGAQHAKLESLVTKLQQELSTALDRKAKAIARAQLTRSGHIYVISNIGSFGEGVYKIGMTRRLEPHVRVKELGDASVPFGFDVHAMIYSEDAPALERTLHQEFDHRRVNRVNNRKEFFRVTLDEIRPAVAKHHGIVTFVTVPEAEDYRKTLAMEREAESTKQPAAAS